MTIMRCYRAMKKAEDDYPEVGVSSRTLGARPGLDLPIDSAGMVQPQTGGMSVTVNDPYKLPLVRLPRNMGGNGRDPLFWMGEERLPRLLSIRIDKGSCHAFVEPIEHCPFESYQQTLHGTRSDWRLY